MRQYQNLMVMLSVKMLFAVHKSYETKISAGVDVTTAKNNFTLNMHGGVFQVRQ